MLYNPATSGANSRTMAQDITVQSILDLLAQGKVNRALKAAKLASKRQPKQAVFHNLAGLALARDGQHRQSVPFFTRALNLNPGNPELQTNLVQALVLSDQHERVDALVAKLAGAAPAPDLSYLHAMSLMRRSDAAAALTAIDHAISAAPEQPRNYGLRAQVLLHLDRAEYALEDYATLARLLPDDPAPLIEQALLLIRLFRQEEARPLLEQAVERDPRALAPHNTLGMLAAMEGRVEDAIAHYRQVISLDPGHGEALLQLAELQDSSENAQMLPALTEALAAAPAKSHDRALMHFARAAIFRQSGESERETDDLARANRIEAERRPVDSRREERAFAALTSGADGLRPIPPEIPVPVFVVGLPRSGTTLLEQVLTGADTVFGCGEVPAGSTLIDMAARNGLDTATLETFAQTYRAGLPEMPANTTHFVDKLPENYKSIGALHAAFPNARFILLQRDPRDVALSMWRAYFAETGLNYCFNQRHMAEEFNRFRRYVLYWQDLLGPELMVLNYEDLVADVTAASRDVAAFCNVTWCPDMAQPQSNANAVRTASAQQVREAVHTRSVRRWKSMEPALKTLISGLDPKLWPGLAEDG